MFNLIPKDVEFFALFEQQAQYIVDAATLLRDLVHNFHDAKAKAFTIKELEHKADQTTHEIIKRLNTTFVTPLDREDIYALAGRLDDVLDFIDAVAERLVIYRIKEPTSACRAMAEVIVETVNSMHRAVGTLRKPAGVFHEHAVEVNRLENRADNLLRETLAELFDQEPDPIAVIKWKEIYETMEVVTDRCEDVVNVIEGIVLKMG
jgi:predicted phosphate transport protein (TIGR00153 family)